MNKYLRDVLTFPRDAAAAWRHQGAAGVAREVRLRTLGRVLRQGRCAVIEQDLEQLRDLELPPGIRIAPFTGDDWSVLAPVASPKTIARFRRIARRGRHCLVAWRGDRPVGYTWLSTQIATDIETHPLPLPADAAYGWDLYVPSEERGTGIGSALVAARLHQARAWGFRRAWRVIEDANHASMRTLDRTRTPGTRVVGTIRFRRLFGIMRSEFTPAADASAAGREAPVLPLATR